MNDDIALIGCLIVMSGSIAAMVIVPAWMKEQTRLSAQRLMSEAIARGQTIEPEMLERLVNPEKVARLAQSPARKNLGNGVVLLALGGAFAAIDWLEDGGFFDGASSWPSIVLIALGTAFLVLSILDYTTSNRDR